MNKVLLAISCFLGVFLFNMGMVFADDSGNFTMNIEKIVVKDESMLKSKQVINGGFVPVAGAEFKVYDISGMLNDYLSKNLDDKQVQDDVKNSLLKQAEHSSDLNEIAEGSTNDEGILKVSLPKSKEFKAYYIVNTKTDANNKTYSSDPFVVITPVSDEMGNTLNEFTVYPKSLAKIDGKHEQITYVPLVQTGRTSICLLLKELFVLPIIV